MSKITIRNAQPADFQAIIALNAAEVVWTSPMDSTKLAALHSLASYHRVVEHNGFVVGFLLAMHSEDKYVNENFDWFLSRYPKFAYIDRIVIDTNSKGLGIGRALYADLFDFAKVNSLPMVCCEYNLTPVNEPSKMFHSKMGFEQVGERTYTNSDKVVSMQAVRL